MISEAYKVIMEQNSINYATTFGLGHVHAIIQVVGKQFDKKLEVKRDAFAVPIAINSIAKEKNLIKQL